MRKANKGSFQKGHKGYWLGKNRKELFSQEQCKMISEIKKKLKQNPQNSPNWKPSYGMKGKHHSLETRLKMKGRRKGELNNMWKGGITPINLALRETFEYEEWRKLVFERDLYICQKCGEIGGKLQADHIKPFSLYPELRLELSNGQTLCKTCHLIKTKDDLKTIINLKRYG